MPLYLTILEGDSPDSAKPLLATQDDGIIKRVAQELAERCGLPQASKRKLFTLTPKPLKDGPPHGEG
jgi:hypothetical protein